MVLRGIWSIVVSGLVLLSLAACAPARTAEPVRNAYPQIDAQGDEFSQSVTINGTKVIVDYPDGHEEAFWLRTIINKQSKAFIHQLYVEVAYLGGRIEFDEASDDTARTLQLHAIDKSKSVCPQSNCQQRNEVFTIDLDDALMQERAAQGFRIKVISRRKGVSMIFAVDSLMIGAQLTAVDNYRRTGAIMAPATPDKTVSSVSQTASGRPYLGIDYMKVLFSGDVIVLRVKPSSPAQAAGLQVNDVLLSYDGQPINSEKDVQSLVDKTTPGSIVKIEIRRGREPMTLTAKM